MTAVTAAASAMLAAAAFLALQAAGAATLLSALGATVAAGGMGAAGIGYGVKPRWDAYAGTAEPELEAEEEATPVKPRQRSGPHLETGPRVPKGVWASVENAPPTVGFAVLETEQPGTSEALQAPSSMMDPGVVTTGGPNAAAAPSAAPGPWFDASIDVALKPNGPAEQPGFTLQIDASFKPGPGLQP